MPTYNGEALLFRITSSGATLFVDSRPVSVVSDSAFFVTGTGVEETLGIFRDDRSGQVRTVEEVSFVELTYPGGAKGVYGGVFTSDDLFYAILAAGDPLPGLPGIAETIDGFFARLGVAERDLDGEPSSPYAAGRSLPFGAIEGLTRDGAIGSGNPGADGLYDEQEIALLYEVAFAREPDLPGLNFWLNKVYAQDGLGVVQIAEAFYGIDAFEQALGRDPDTLSNPEIVEALYSNVLDRPGLASQNDPAGYAFWLDAVEKGLTRPQLMREFAVSAENVANAAYVTGLAQGEDGGWML